MQNEELKINDSDDNLEERFFDKEEVNIQDQLMVNLAEEEFEQEAITANLLAQLRQEAENIEVKGQSYGSPSMVKWGSLFTLGVVNDVVDVLTLTGFLEIFVWLVSLGLTALILLIIWFTDGNLKKAQNFAESVEKSTEEVQAGFASQVSQIESRVKGLAEGATGRLKKIPGLGGIGVRDTARKNPLARAFLGSAFESIPFLGSLNLITIWLFFAYMAERHTYKIARESGKTAKQEILESAAKMI